MIQQFIADLSKRILPKEAVVAYDTSVNFGREEYRVRITDKDGVHEYYVIFRTPDGWDLNCLYYV